MTTLQIAMQELEGSGFEVEQVETPSTLEITNWDGIIETINVVQYAGWYDTEKTIDQMKNTSISKLTFKAKKSGMTYIGPDINELIEMARNLFTE